MSNVGTQTELIYAQTIRERLLAMLAAFFSALPLLLAGIGLYGVLTYSVLQRENKFGIRIAIGARIGSIARLLTTEVFAMVLVGAVIGLALGVASVRYVETLLFGVKGSDPNMLILPATVLFASALLAALPAVIEPPKLTRRSCCAENNESRWIRPACELRMVGRAFFYPAEWWTLGITNISITTGSVG